MNCRYDVTTIELVALRFFFLGYCDAPDDVFIDPTDFSCCTVTHGLNEFKIIVRVLHKANRDI